MNIFYSLINSFYFFLKPFFAPAFHLSSCSISSFPPAVHACTHRCICIHLTFKVAGMSFAGEGCKSVQTLFHN